MMRIFLQSRECKNVLKGWQNKEVLENVLRTAKLRVLKNFSGGETLSIWLSGGVCSDWKELPLQSLSGNHGFLV